MNTNRIQILITVLLLSVIIYFSYFNNNNSSQEEEIQEIELVESHIKPNYKLYLDININSLSRENYKMKKGDNLGAILRKFDINKIGRAHV